MSTDQMTEADALLIATHRHYKGGLYRYIGDGPHTENGETLVAYQHIWPHKQGFWFRPKSMFYGKLPDGRLRFEPLPSYVAALQERADEAARLKALEDQPDPATLNAPSTWEIVGTIAPARPQVLSREPITRMGGDGTLYARFAHEYDDRIQPPHPGGTSVMLWDGKQYVDTLLGVCRWCAGYGYDGERRV